MKHAKHKKRKAEIVKVRLVSGESSPEFDSKAIHDLQERIKKHLVFATGWMMGYSHGFAEGLAEKKAAKRKNKKR